jgi:hypothetical protein
MFPGLPVEAEKPKVNSPGWVAEELKKLGPGYRDEPLTRICGKLRYGGFSKEDALAILGPACEETGSYYKLAQKVESIWNRYPAGKAPLSVSSVSDFMAVVDEVRWIVPGIFPERGLALIAGLPESTKTWQALDLAVAVASGQPWLHLFPVQKKNVLYIEQERPRAELQRRLGGVLRGRGLTIGGVPGLSILSQSTIRINDPESQSEFRSILSSTGAELVVVDSFSTFHTIEAREKKDMSELFEILKSFRNGGVSFVFVDHESKMGYGEASIKAPSPGTVGDSVVKLMAIESLLMTRLRAPGAAEVYHKKSTQGSPVLPFRVEVKDEAGGIRVTGSAIEEAPF